MKIKTINEINKTENEAEKRMNGTENSQTEESESKDEFPFNLIREKSQESEKSPTCLTKSDLEKIQSQKNWEMRESEMSTKNKVLNFSIKRTSRLWINYMNCINIVETFICAERTGNLLPT